MAAKIQSINGRRQFPEQTPAPEVSHAFKMLARLLGRIAAHESLPMQADILVSVVRVFGNDCSLA